MEVQFRRTDERRYIVAVHRDALPPLEFQGPGFDPHMPHDLLHFIVESELGLTHGIFGFMAAGGEAGGSPQLAAGEDHRAARRRRAHAHKRDGKRLQRGDRADGPRSERAAYVCQWEWLRRSEDPRRRQRAAELAPVTDPRSSLPEDERTALSATLARILARMDELSARWARLAVGESLSLEWSPRRAAAARR